MSRRNRLGILSAAAVVVVAGVAWQRGATLIGIGVGFLMAYAMVAENASFRVSAEVYGGRDGRDYVPEHSAHFSTVLLGIATLAGAVVVTLAAVGHALSTAAAVLPFVVLGATAPGVLTPDRPRR